MDNRRGRVGRSSPLAMPRAAVLFSARGHALAFPATALLAIATSASTARANRRGRRPPRRHLGPRRPLRRGDATTRAPPSRATAAGDDARADRRGLGPARPARRGRRRVRASARRRPRGRRRRPEHALVAARARPHRVDARPRRGRHFAPLARLEHVRRDPAVSADPAAIAALAKDLGAAFPAGAREDRGAHGRRRGVARRARAQGRRDRGAPPRRRRPEDRRHHRPPRGARARRRARRRGAPRAGQRRRRTRARRSSTPASSSRCSASSCGAGCAARQTSSSPRSSCSRPSRSGGARPPRGRLAEAGRALRDLAPVALPFVAFMAIPGGLLAAKYESGNAAPFYLLGAAALPLVLVARAWSAVGSATQGARLGRSVLCAATVAATAFTVLDRLDPRYLEGFGLDAGGRRPGRRAGGARARRARRARGQLLEHRERGRHALRDGDRRRGRVFAAVVAALRTEGVTIAGAKKRPRLRPPPRRPRRPRDRPLRAVGRVGEARSATRPSSASTATACAR